MTLLQIKTAVAALFGRNVSDLTINGQDMFLTAVNQVRRDAELLHDFEFSRKLLTLTVDGVTGGSLDNAVIKGTTTLVKTKTVIDIGMFDDADNLRPSEWTTVAESLERQRAGTGFTPRYPTDQDLRSGPCGVPRFEVSGNQIYRFGKGPVSYPIGIEVYTFTEDWTEADLAPEATVTGTITPNLTGVYPVVGTFNDHPLFYRDGPDYWIVWAGTMWVIAQSIVNASVFFSLPVDSQNPAGSYTPNGGATGTAVVTMTGASSVNDWTLFAHSYLTWGCVVYLNHLFKTFVYRQEGNLPPPEKARDAGLAAFVEWDAAKFETNRRHG